MEWTPTSLTLSGLYCFFCFFLIQLKTSFFNSMWLESLIKKILLTKWTLQSDYNVHHRKWLTSGSSNMKLLQWPFFSNTDVALLEPDDVSNQWLVWFGLSYCFPGNHQSGVSLLKDHTHSTRKRSLQNLSINCFKLSTCDHILRWRRLFG